MRLFDEEHTIDYLLSLIKKQSRWIELAIEQMNALQTIVEEQEKLLEKAGRLLTESIDEERNKE